MEIERNIVYLDEDDKQFIREMIEDSIISDIIQPISLRWLATLWYERGIEDGSEQ